MAEQWTGTNAWLYIEGPTGQMVEGECLDKLHPDEVQLLSYDIHVSAEKAAKDAWKPNFDPVTLVVVSSTASGVLFGGMCTGVKFKRFIISCRKPGSTLGGWKGDYLQWRFSDVQVTDFTFKVTDDKPEETIKITYQQIEMYICNQKKDGTLESEVNKAWSNANNKEGTPMLPFLRKSAQS